MIGRTLLGGFIDRALSARVDALSTAVAASSTDPATQQALKDSVASAAATAATAQTAANTALSNTATLQQTVTQLNQLSADYIAAVQASQTDRAQLNARVAALEAKQVTITSGAYTSPALTLLSPTTASVTVTFVTPMPDTNYRVTANLIGGAALLGAARITGVTAKSTTGVVVGVTFTGLSSVVGANYTVEAIAVRYA